MFSLSQGVKYFKGRINVLSNVKLLITDVRNIASESSTDPPNEDTKTAPVKEQLTCKTVPVPYIPLNNGTQIPQLGLGTWQLTPKQSTNVIKMAIDLGFRHFDCAYDHLNECEIGKAFKDKICDGTVKREDLFITSKLWNIYQRPEHVMEGFKKSLDCLGLDYLDLYLIHWPTAFLKSECGGHLPRDEFGKIQYDCDVEIKDTWAILECLVNECLVKGIGLSNFNRCQTQHILDLAKVKPVLNQIESHPYLPNCELVNYLRENDLQVTAYSSLGAPTRPDKDKKQPVLMKDPMLVEMSKRYKKTIAQLLLRFQVERGLIVIPKATKKKEMQEDLKIFEFEMCADDIQKLFCLASGIRYIGFLEICDHPNYPFKDAY